MSVFVLDDLSGTDAQFLASRVPQGASATPNSLIWFKPYGLTTNLVATTGGSPNKMRNSAIAGGLMANNVTTPSAPYKISVKVKSVSSELWAAGVAACIVHSGDGNTTNAAYYNADYRFDSQVVRLQKWSVTTPTLIGTAQDSGSTGQDNLTVTTGSSIWVQLEVTATGLNVYTSTDSTDGTDGSWTIRIVSTDTSISRAGQTGLSTYATTADDTHDFQLSNFAMFTVGTSPADDLTVASSAGTVAATTPVTISVAMSPSGGLPASTETVALSDGSAGGSFVSSSLTFSTAETGPKTTTYTPAVGAIGTNVTITATGTGAFSASHTVVIAVIAAPTINTVCVGDSITAGYNGSTDVPANAYPTQMATQLGTVSVITNVGVDGVGSAYFSGSNWTSRVQTYHDSGKTNVAVLTCGGNDIGGGETGAQAWTAYQLIINAAIAGGWRPVLATLMSRETISETERQAFNTLVRANWRSAGAYGVIDLGSDARMGLPTSYSNATYFVDTIHPTAAGYVIMAQYVSQAVLDAATSAIAAIAGGVKRRPQE